MPALEEIRELYPNAIPASPEARRHARLALVSHAERRRRPGRRVLLPAAGLAAAAAAAAVALVGVGNEASVDVGAAAVLRDAAAKVKTQKPAGNGSVLYVKSVDAYLSTWAEAGFSVLVPHVREIWQGPRGGLLDGSSGEPKFLSERDRERWIAAGSPNVYEGDLGSLKIERQEESDLPADPDALFEYLEDEARGHSEGTHRQMFTRLGDYFRETNITPAQRAALYEVAARIPGVDLVGPVRDPVGRKGIAVAMDQRSDGVRHTLVIDPSTGTLLAEEQVALENNFHGYPAGTVVGHSTYLETRMVKRVGARPK